MDEVVVKRGPGRPPKPRPAEAGEAFSSPPAMITVKITHYKVQTSSGRLIAGMVHELPAAEAENLIAEGHAVPWQS